MSKKRILAILCSILMVVALLPSGVVLPEANAATTELWSGTAGNEQGADYPTLTTIAITPEIDALLVDGAKIKITGTTTTDGKGPYVTYATTGGSEQESLAYPPGGIYTTWEYNITSAIADSIVSKSYTEIWIQANLGSADNAAANTVTISKVELITTSGGGSAPTYQPGGTPFYDLQQDDTLTAGTGLGSYLTKSGGTAAVTGSLGSWTIAMTDRTSDWHALDIKWSNMSPKDDKMYAFRVEGTAAEGAKMKLAATVSPYGGVGDPVTVGADGLFEIDTLPIKRSELPETLIRIQSQSSKGDFTVTNIEITESDPPTGPSGDIGFGTGLSSDPWNGKKCVMLSGVHNLSYANSIESFEMKISSADVANVVCGVLMQGDNSQQGYGNNSKTIGYKGSSQSVSTGYEEIRDITNDGIVAGKLAMSSSSDPKSTQQNPFSSDAATQFGRFRVTNEVPNTGEDFTIEYIAFIDSNGKYLLDALGKPVYSNGTAFDNNKDASKMPEPGSNTSDADYKMSEDANVKAKDDGTQISKDGLGNIILAGSPTVTVVDYNSGKSLKVETPSSEGRDYFGIDIKAGSTGVLLDKDASYSVIVTGHTDAVPANGTGLEVQAVYKDTTGAEKYSSPKAAEFTGTDFTIIFEVKPSSLSNYSDFVAFRIKQKQSSTTFVSPFYVDEIEITHTGGSGGGSSTPPSSGGSSEPAPIPPVVEVTADVNEDGAAVVTISAEDLSNLVKQAAAPKQPGDSSKPTVSIAVDPPKEDVKSIELSLPADVISQIANETKASVSINIGFATIVFDTKALKTIIAEQQEETGSKGDVNFSVVIADKSVIPEATAEVIGDRPVFDFTVSYGDTTVSDFGGGTVDISVPYTLNEGEVGNALIVYYIDENGKAVPTMGKYKNTTATMDFTVTHFSVYAIGYNFVEFSDVAKNSSYFLPVTFLAARGVTNGVGNGLYGVDRQLTRGMLVVMLMRAFGLEPGANLTDNFDDAGDTWYTNYLAEAKKLGIAQGVGDNKFAPEQELSEWELQTFISRTLQMLNCPKYEVSETASTANKVTRGTVARTLYAAINSGLFNIQAEKGPAVLVTIYDMTEDDEVVGRADGVSYTGTTKLQNCSTTLTTKDYNGGKSLMVSGRTTDWRGIDIKQESVRLQEGETYSITIKGHVEGDVPEGATVKFYPTNNSGEGAALLETELVSKSEFVLENSEITFAEGDLSGVTFFRINTTNAVDVTLFIDSIFIARVDY